MRAETEAALIDSELCWTLWYYQSLELDEESKACGMPPPVDRWHLTIIVSLEDTAEGWGSSSDAAALDALAKWEAMQWDVPGQDLAGPDPKPRRTH